LMATLAPSAGVSSAAPAMSMVRRRSPSMDSVAATRPVALMIPVNIREALIDSDADRVLSPSRSDTRRVAQCLGHSKAQPRNAVAGRLGPNPSGRALARVWTASVVVYLQ